MYSNMQLRQVEHMKRQLDARDAKQQNAATRHKWLERQKNANYRNEYDRIRGELSRTSLHHHTKEKLLKREGQLKRLFSEGNV